MKTIGIIGSRRRDSDKDFVECKQVFSDIYQDGDRIVSGHCPQGGDRFAEELAEELGLTVENGKLILHPADWDKHGRGAGFVRNTNIAEDSDILIAVVAEDRKGGTEDTIKKAIKYNKQIVLVPQPTFDIMNDV
tara:strand:- start:14090 stop:14491 length:402 start_codon:yes stop_codon:yes gene_type:complete